MTTTNETRQVYGISNDFDTLDIGMKQSTLTEVMKMFIADKRKIPARLLEDLKKVKKQNKKRMGYTLHKDCKNTRKALKVYYKQYKHLDKYYPKNLDNITPVASLQRGERAVDIEKKYERLIRLKCDSHIFMYNDDTDNLMWVKDELFRMIKNSYDKSYREKHIEKIDFSIGDVKWYGIKIEEDDDMTRLNYGLTALSDDMIWGLTAVLDSEKGRDAMYDWVRK